MMMMTFLTFKLIPCKSAEKKKNSRKKNKNAESFLIFFYSSTTNCSTLQRVSLFMFGRRATGFLKHFISGTKAHVDFCCYEFYSLFSKKKMVWALIWGTGVKGWTEFGSVGPFERAGVEWSQRFGQKKGNRNVGGRSPFTLSFLDEVEI